MTVVGVALAACFLLATGAAAKVADPRSLSVALGRLGLPHHPRLVRLLGGVEALIAVTVAFTGTVAGWLAVATSYAVFTAFVLLVRRRGGALASCGCFGGTDTPATRLHAGLTAGAAAVAVSAAATDVPGLLAMAAGPALAVTVVAATVTYLSVVLLGTYPQVRALAAIGE